MVRSRSVVVVFVAVQLVLPALLLVVRLATQGWWPTEVDDFGWQMFSVAPQDAVCRRTDRC